MGIGGGSGGGTYTPKPSPPPPPNVNPTVQTGDNALAADNAAQEAQQRAQAANAQNNSSILTPSPSQTAAKSILGG